MASKYLPERAAELVMSVFAGYEDHLGKVFKEANPSTENGRDW
jgi:hypothetical protein